MAQARIEGGELTAIHLFACARCIGPVCKADKRKALGSLCLAVPCQEHSCNPTKSFEQIPQFLFFGQFAHLR